MIGISKSHCGPDNYQAGILRAEPTRFLLQQKMAKLQYLEDFCLLSIMIIALLIIRSLYSYLRYSGAYLGGPWPPPLGRQDCKIA